VARGPFPVLVAVGVEFCRVSQSLCHGWVFGLVLCRGRSIQIDKHILGECNAQYPFEMGLGRWGWGMYRSISGGPGQGPELDNELALEVIMLGQYSHLLGPAMVAGSFGS
jgi:hypothetical protein